MFPDVLVRADYSEEKKKSSLIAGLHEYPCLQFPLGFCETLDRFDLRRTGSIYATSLKLGPLESAAARAFGDERIR